MSTRFKWLAAITYGGLALSLSALALLILGFGQVGQCSTVDGTWEACETRTTLLSSLVGYPLLSAVVASIVAVCLRPRPGERGKWIAASAILVAPPLGALLLWGLLHLGIR
jgi:hypothetical protein